MSFNKRIVDIVNEIRNCGSKKEKKELLLKYDSDPFRLLLRLEYDERIEFIIPEELPRTEKYTKDELDEMGLTEKTAPKLSDFKLIEYPGNDSPRQLNDKSSWGTYWVFIKNDKSSKIKKSVVESKFLSFMTDLNKDEAILFMEVRNGNLKLGLNKSEIKKTLPGIF